MKQWWNGLDETDQSDVRRTAQIVGGVVAASVVLLGVMPVVGSLVGGLPVF